MGFISWLFTPRKTRLTRVFLDWTAPAESRISALDRLVRIGDAPTVEELMGVLTETSYNRESEQVQSAASRALVELGEQGVEPLIDFLHYDVDSIANESRRYAAARVLGLIGGKRAEIALEQLLVEQKEYSRRKRLGQEGYRWVEDALLHIREPDQAQSKDSADAEARLAIENRERENIEHRKRIEACSHQWETSESGRDRTCSKCGHSISNE